MLQRIYCSIYNLAQPQLRTEEDQARIVKMFLVWNSRKQIYGTDLFERLEIFLMR